jgi:hypothetical protein
MERTPMRRSKGRPRSRYQVSHKQQRNPSIEVISQTKTEKSRNGLSNYQRPPKEHWKCRPPPPRWVRVLGKWKAVSGSASRGTLSAAGIDFDAAGKCGVLGISTNPWHTVAVYLQAASSGSPLDIKIRGQNSSTKVTTCCSRARPILSWGTITLALT